MTKSKKGGGGYNGNCRMIEIGSPGIPFRLTVNVDHIDTIRFEEMKEQRPIGPATPAVTDAEGKIVTDAIPPAMGLVSTGHWTVILVSNGQQNGINFPNIESAMGCYNAIINMLQAVGIPHVFMGPLKPPPKPSEIVGVDGKAIADAVDAADLHPDLAGGDGAGVAENDDDLEGRALKAGLYQPKNDDDLDEEFELSNEDLELLEHPEIDEGEIDEAFAKPKEPPAEN